MRTQASQRWIAQSITGPVQAGTFQWNFHPRRDDVRLYMYTSNFFFFTTAHQRSPERTIHLVVMHEVKLGRRRDQLQCGETS